MNKRISCGFAFIVAALLIDVTASYPARGETKETRDVNSLIMALKDENSNVRARSAEALGQIKDSCATEPLIAALKDKSWLVREGAAKALGEIKDACAVEPLMAALKDQNSDVRRRAAEALGSLSWKPKDEKEQIDYLIAENNWDGCAKLGSSAVEPLMAALKDQDSHVRAGAIKALGEIKDARTIEPLIVALKDENSNVRADAAKALGEIKDACAVEPLMAALKDESSAVRRRAAKALGSLSWKPKDEKEQTDYLIAENNWDGCAKLGSSAVEPLMAALKDHDSNVRRGAAKALGEIKDARAVEALMVLLDDNESRVRIVAVQIQTDQTVLAKIALTGKYPDSREEAIGKVNDQNVIAKVAFEDKFANVRQAAVGKLADQMLLARIAIEDKDFGVRQTAERRVDPEMLNKAKQDIAVAIAKLASISEPNQLAQVAVKDSWRDVRKAAVESLSDQVALAIVVNTAKDWDVVKIAFNKITDTTVLTKLAEEMPDPAVKLAIQVRWGKETWHNATQKASQGKLTTGDVIGAIALFPQDKAIADVADELCLAYISKGDISRVPELIELLNLYGTKTLAEDYLNCGQGELDSEAREWAHKHGYQTSIGSGSHRASWGSQ